MGSFLKRVIVMQGIVRLAMEWECSLLCVENIYHIYSEIDAVCVYQPYFFNTNSFMKNIIFSLPYYGVICINRETFFLIQVCSELQFPRFRILHGLIPHRLNMGEESWRVIPIIKQLWKMCKNAV
jgi:hypothetical protein